MRQLAKKTGVEQRCPAHTAGWVAHPARNTVAAVQRGRCANIGAHDGGVAPAKAGRGLIEAPGKLKKWSSPIGWVQKHAKPAVDTRAATMQAQRRHMHAKHMDRRGKEFTRQLHRQQQDAEAAHCPHRRDCKKTKNEKQKRMIGVRGTPELNDRFSN